MATRQFDHILSHLRALAGPPDDCGDAELLERFLLCREEAAFAALVRRHGPLVLGVCRRMLRHEQDAEDAFQAAFLVLARKAGSLRNKGALAAWLYEVAYHIAARMRAEIVRRTIHERRVADMPTANADAQANERELVAVLDEELNRLPEKYRRPLVLCCLQGKTHAQAAQELGLPAGSVSRLVGRARELLRERLAGRGFTVPAALLGTALTAETLTAAVPHSLIIVTARAARLVALGGVSAAISVSGRSIELAETAMRAMSLARLKMTVILLMLGSVLGGAGLVAQQTWRGGPPERNFQEQPNASPEAAAPKAAPAVRKDRFGDPLPSGAIARLGTTRFRQSGHVGRLAFSPDGKTLAAGSDHSLTAGSNDSSVVLWDVTTGQATRTFGRFDLSGSPSALAFSPDGKALTLGIDNSLVMPVSNWWVGISRWDFVSRKIRHPLVLRDLRSIHSLAFSPDEDHWAAADDRGGVFLWDIAGGDKETRLDVPADVSYFVAFSPDKKDLILATRTDMRTFGKKGRGEIIFWDLAERKKRRSFLVDRERFIDSMAVSADGKTLAVLAASAASLWDIDKGEKVRDLKPGADVRCLAFSGDGRMIALGCHHRMGRKQTGPVYNPADGVVYLLDVATGEERRMLEGAASCLAFSPDGRLLATGDLDSLVRLWDTRTGKLVTPVGGHTDAVTCVAVSRDGKTIVSAADGGTACVWDAAQGVLCLRRQIQTGFGIYAGFGAVRVTPDGQVLATRGSTPYGPPHPTPILWDVRTGKELLALTPPNPRGGPACPINVSPDGKTVVTGTEDTVVLWDVATRKERLRLRGCEGPISSIVFSADGTTLTTCDSPSPKDGQSCHPSLRWWDVKTGKQLHKITAEHLSSLFALSPDGKLCATSSRNGIDLWDVTRGEKLRTIRSPIPSVTALTFSPDDQALLSGDSRGSICFWDVKTGKQMRKLTGHRGSVRALAFAGDNRLVSACSDTTLLLWDLKELPNDAAP